MTDYAERNRSLKKVLEGAFGKGNVRVKGSRGTAYGWVTCNMAYAPRNRREWQELQVLCNQLIDAAGIKVGTYDSADYGSGREIHFNFEDCREKADSWGDKAWRHNLSREDWDAMQKQEW